MKKQIQILLLTLAISPLMAQAQQAFSSPEAAANALVSAIDQQNEAALRTLLGDDWRHYLPPERVDPDAVARFLRDWRVSHRIVRQSGIAWLDVGKTDWRLPIPLEKSASGWRFDMRAAADAILTRAIGRNELSAIEAMHAYVVAQQAYYQQNHVLAQKIISSEGKKDGLYWPTGPGETPSPLGPGFSPVAPGEGYHGYRFRIIGDSDSSAALLAWPLVYGETGIMSFMVDQQDRVYQANLGEETEKKAQAITRFAPDAGWQVVGP